jgi:hypothetical protein
MPGCSNDSCLVVITGQNKIPVIKTIHFSDIHKEFINLTSTVIDDSQGNDNKVADYGESIYLKLTLSNLGLTDSHGLYAKISSSSEWVTITGDSTYIGTLKARSDTILSNSLAINISNNVPDLGVATVKLILKDQATEKHYSIDIGIHAPVLQIINCIMDDKSEGNGDNIPDPGESFRLVFKVLNNGSSNISGQFNIVNQEGDLSIVEQSIKSGILKFGQVTDIPVLVKLGSGAPSGSLISVAATLDCNPYIINKDFSFRVGKVRESFEASSFNVFPWTNISAIPWILTSENSYDGNISARSGDIGQNGSTSLSLRTIYATDDSVKFYYKVSSEPNYDFLTFRLNDVEVFKKSGETPWSRKAVAVKAGLNKMEWTYKKDNTVSEGSDCAWIDMIDFAQSGTVSYIQRDLQVARVVKPATNNHYGQEDITVKVLNPGKDTLNGFYLAYEVNNRYPPVRQFFNNKLIPNSDSVSVTFSTKADLSKYGIYNIVAYGVDNKDDYAFNDTTYASIENRSLSETLVVFPNPFSDVLTVTVNSMSAERIRISITNESGIKLYDIEKDILSGSNSFTFNDLKLVPSVYFLNINGASINKTIPVLKVDK